MKKWKNSSPKIDNPQNVYVLLPILEIELPAKFQDGGREVRWAECNQFVCVTKQLILFGLLLNESCQGTETAYNNATSVLSLLQST